MKKFINKVSSSHKLKIINKNVVNFFYFFLDISFVFFCIFNNLIKYKQIYKKNVILVSAASEAYYEYLNNLLNNISKYHFSEIIIYDLGLTNEQVLNLKKINYIKLVKFEYSEYPSFISEKEEYNQIGSYAWKSIIIKEVVHKYRTQVIWLDSANLINRKFIFLKIALTSLGYFSTHSVDSIKKWTHDSVIQKLNLESKLLKKTNLNGAIIGFDYQNDKAMNFLYEWNEYCLQKELISPKNSSKDNHRHDQTLLSILFYRLKLPYIPRLHKIYGVTTHQWHDRIYYIVQPKVETDIPLRESWYRQFGHISTNTFKDSKKVVFLNEKSFQNFKKRRLRKKTSYLFIATEHEAENIDWKIFKNSKFKVNLIIQEKIRSEAVPSDIIFSRYNDKKIEEILDATLN